MLQSRLPSVRLHANQWLFFSDVFGPGYAQPDVYFILSNKVILFECKLTEKLSGHEQLKGLYAPLLEHIYSRPVTKVLVCRGLKLRYREEVEDLAGVLASSSKNVLTWQWLP